MVTARRRECPQAYGHDRPSSLPRHHSGVHSYRQQARRLRARFRGRPALLQESLQTLSRNCDAAQPARPASVGTPALTAVFEVSPETVRRFSRMVRDRLEGQILRFEPRQLLIRAAGRMGIDRFQANLIIAAVQHAQTPREHAELSAQAPAAGWRLILAIFLLTEVAIAFGLWRIFTA